MKVNAKYFFFANLYFTHISQYFVIIMRVTLCSLSEFQQKDKRQACQFVVGPSRPTKYYPILGRI